MSGNSRAIILWLLGACAAFFLYCAIKGYTPQSVLVSLVDRSKKPAPLGGSAKTSATSKQPFNFYNLPTSYNASGTPSTTGNNVPPSKIMTA